MPATGQHECVLYASIYYIDPGGNMSTKMPDVNTTAAPPTTGGTPLLGTGENASKMDQCLAICTVEPVYDGHCATQPPL